MRSYWFRHRLAGERLVAADAGHLGLTPRYHRLQAARIGGVDGHVGAHRVVDDGADLDPVLQARLAHAAAEVHDRLALVDAAQRVGQRAQRFEPPVGVEDVHFRLVGRERGAVVGGAVGVAGRALSKPRPPVGSSRRSRDRAIPIGGEVLEDSPGRRERHDGDQMPTRELRDV
jgi:hypothetical protein